MQKAAFYFDIQEDLRTKGFGIIPDADFDFSLESRASINALYNEAILQSDMPHVYPADRLRARDVVHYKWQDKELFLTEHSTITIKTPKGTRGNHPHEVVREYKRIFLLSKPAFRNIIECLLYMIPSEERQAEGTIGINLFKTFSDVVSGPHQDGVQFVGIYIPGKHCTGSETTLTLVNKPKEVILRRSLEVGDLLIFRDKNFMHNVSPLESPMDNSIKFRNALILTIDYKDTYRL